MTQSLTIVQVLYTILASAVVILATRATPFLLFSRRNPPLIIKFIDKFIPPMIMAILVIYCFKDVNYVEAPYGIPYFICVALTAVLHLCFKNSMISILGSTIIYMILIHLI